MAADTEGKKEIREFSAFLLDLPQVHTEASEKLNELITKVRETGKGGTLTLKLKVGIGKTNDRILEIIPDVTAALPKVPLRGGIFYPDANNNPRREDPSIQPLFGMDDVKSAPEPEAPKTAEAKDVK